MLYYSGRIDFQVKLHGYRIELGDIEANIMKINGVTTTAVLPLYNGEKIRYLVAFVKKENAEKTFKERQEIRNKLKEMLPDYMVPKKIVFLDEIPLTNNGKVNRKQLEEML